MTTILQKSLRATATFRCMAFKRSAVRSRLSPPQNTDFSMKSRCFSNFLTHFQFKISFGSTLGSTKPVNILPFCRRKDGQNGIHPREDQRKENRIFQVQGLRGTGRRRQASFQVYYLVSARRTHPRHGSELSPKGGGTVGG